MAARQKRQATYPQPNHAHAHSPGDITLNILHTMLLSGLFMYLLSGCSLLPTTATSSPKTLQQPHQKLIYVALGASDTFGFGASDPYNQNWAADLAARLGPRYRLINLGIPSIHVHDALTTELPVALDAHPDLVTIWLAVNDLADQVPVKSYAQDLDTLLSRLQAKNSQMRIAVANVPDLAILPHFSKQATLHSQALQQQILSYNAAIASIVHQHHAILIDLSQQSYDLQHHPEYISEDGLHPTTLGYARLADLFYQALQVSQNG
jgi:lysophospholipase L1-like esterase